MTRWDTLKQLWKPFMDSHAAVYASSACFYILLSVLPASVLLSSFVHFFSLPLQPIRQAAVQLIPGRFLALFDLLFTQTASNAFISVSAAIALLWSASKSVMAISDGLRALTGIRHRQNFIWRRLRAMAVFVMLSGLMVFVLVLYVFGRKLFLILGAARLPFYRLSGFYVPALLSGVFACVYHLLPGKTLPIRYCCLGGLLAAAGWVSISFIFSIYVNLSFGYRIHYGGLGLLLLACIWLQWCICLLLYGGLLTDLLAHRDYHPMAILRNAFRKI